LFHYDERGELASRSKVSNAIFDWKRKNGREVYLAFDAFEQTAFRERFPTIYNNLLDEGYLLPQQRVPISPAFHYAMGGIRAHRDAKVVGYKNLYAVGEVAYSGVHGANRLASNSLLEGLVFSKIASEDIVANGFKTVKKELPIDDTMLVKDGDKKLKNRLRTIMWDDAGIVRTQKSLSVALEQVEEMLGQDIGKLLRFRLLTSKEIITSALAREKSLGAHQIKE
jgi:L-aspartate oxidase